MEYLSPETSRRLGEIAAEDKTTRRSVLDSVVKEYYRAWFFRRADAPYETLQRDESAWELELAERQDWDATLLDGIDCDEHWHEDGIVDIIPAKAVDRT